MSIHWLDGRRESRAIHLRVEGWLAGYQPAPILIRDQGGSYNEPLIAELVQAYEKKGWEYKIVPADEKEPPPR